MEFFPLPLLPSLNPLFLSPSISFCTSDRNHTHIINLRNTCNHLQPLHWDQEIQIKKKKKFIYL